MILNNKNAQKPRRFRFWAICLLIVVVSACIVFVIEVGKESSEPFISANIVHRENLVGDAQLISIEVSNKMSFNVNYSIVVEVKEKVVSGTSGMIARGVSGTYLYGFTNMLDYSITGHAQKREVIMGPSDGARWTVYYLRQLKPIEISILKNFPWLTKHYPFNRRRSFIIYEPVTNVQVSSESKQQP